MGKVLQSLATPRPEPSEARGILCPGCGRPASRVIESRPGVNAQRRRHECTHCGTRFTTVEQISGLVKRRASS